jgi:dinuclear metal center YbgI/SA1388 family protein
MTIGEIYDQLDVLSPFELQEPWDNSGLLVGAREDRVETICLSLDVDEHVLASVPDNTLIIAHHPLIFKGLKQFNPAAYPASLLKPMITRGIGLVAMHTNIDKTHLNRYVCEKVLGFEVLSQEAFTCTCKFEGTLEALGAHVKHAFGLSTLRVVDADKRITSVAITTGSGGDLIGQICASCFLTGDIKYHHAMEAKANGLSLIDIGHFESERYFGEALMRHLKNFPLKVIMSNSKNPFDTI